MKRWTWKRLHREVIGHCTTSCDADAALTHAYVVEDVRTSLGHTMVATMDLYRSLARAAVTNVESMLLREDDHARPAMAELIARDLRRRAELLVGIATTLENHARALAVKQGAGL